MSAAYRRQPAPPGALRLDANEGPAPPFVAGPVPLPPSAFRRYPDAAELTADLAARHGVAPEQVLVTAGGDDGIERLCRHCLAGGRELLLTEPTFEMFLRHGRRAGGRVRSVPWWEGAYPVDAVADRAGPGTGLVVVVSPNNPTGAAVTADELRRLRAATGETPLLVDAAYAEFAEEDLTTVALGLRATVVLRTFSKAWGLAGLRVGYLLGPAPLLDELRAWGQPYAVAATSLAVVRGALPQADAVAAGAREIVATRARLADRLAALGARPLPSQGNFVLCRPRDPRLLQDGLAALGVSVRGWPRDPLLAPCLRITCPATPAEERQLDDALATVLAPEALLLDMDGVLADEGPSYRATIVAVLAAEGLAVSRREIAEAKAAGDANNDWELTRRLLSARGVERDLDEVVARFQAIYEGDDARPGLCRRETLIPQRTLLERLAARRPLAVVTGRPRADAERFLDRFDLTGLFAAVVTLDDAAPKPDPAPVRLALERLGARRAWLVGDTPDDVAAARAAGVLPLGVRPPDAADAVGPALAAAGAVRVLDRLHELEEMLP